MPCKYCDSENKEIVGYCYHCGAELCEEHNRKGRGGISYCVECDSQYYKEMESLIKKMKKVSRNRHVSKEKMKELIIESLNNW